MTVWCSTNFNRYKTSLNQSSIDACISPISIMTRQLAIMSKLFRPWVTCRCVDCNMTIDSDRLATIMKMALSDKPNNNNNKSNNNNREIVGEFSGGYQSTHSGAKRKASRPVVGNVVSLWRTRVTVTPICLTRQLSTRLLPAEFVISTMIHKDPGTFKTREQCNTKCISTIK
ncbi:unnamed protein product [Medioppia subpectinata]|uniref:Uncharacterized protein n=1 Tax=Medioppia subpectinata TaxID=1979941 RepID=A0A7R9Q080_9ACAR|nr:unnamed protein product [Medioppia subpectinata]CAG2107249.1 unnamed protein product [Medioppia subpectinata]